VLRGGVSKLLDAALANELLLVAGMGKPTRNELLAEYYLRAAGVAAVWIDAEGHVGAALALSPLRAGFVLEF
jgi:hypothetical protein